MTHNVRDAAVRLLDATLNRKGYSNHLFESFVARHPEVEENDRGFLKNLFFGVLRRLYTLDAMLAERCRSPYAKVPEKIKLILRVGLYQIVFMDKVPPHAAVNESVKLAKRYGHPGTVKLVNALLRKAAGGIAVSEIADGDTSETVAQKSSHPLWMAEAYLDSFGRETALEVLEANNDQPPFNVHLRDAEKLSVGLEETDAEVIPNRFSRYGAEIRNAPARRIRQLLGEGVIVPQDQSSLVAASLFAGAEGRLLELCCGRGSKSAVLAREADEKAVMFHADLSHDKLSSFARSSGRTPNAVCCDLLKPLPFTGMFDHIFLDAPCSNLGTVRRHPELKYRKRLIDVRSSAERQQELLSNAAKYLASGGRLLYAVCSMEPEETTAVVGRFLASHDGFRPVDIGALRPDLYEAGLVTGGCFRPLPGRHGMDGFYAALVERM